MKKAMKRKSGIVILLLIVLAAVLLTTGSYAVYTNLSGNKGVVVVGGEEICYFSSDKLNGYSDGSELASALDNKMLVNFESNEKTLAFKVKNTSRKGNGTANKYDIGYRLILRVLDNGGNDITETAGVTVSKDNMLLGFDGNGVSTTEFFLGGGGVASHLFTVQFPDGCEDNMTVAIEARPSAESKNATKNTTLYREFIPTSGYSDNYSFSCMGKFSDNTEEAANTPEQYHAFNYLITVSNGSGTVTLHWDKNRLKLDAAAYAKLGVTAEDVVQNGEIRSVTFDADASSVEQYYEIIFYKEEGFFSSSPTWNDMDTMYAYVEGQEAVSP